MGIRSRANLNAVSTPTAAPQLFQLAIGNSTTEATLYRVDRADAPCMLVFPALGTPARPYQRLAMALQARGVHTLIADWRGMASSSVRAAREVDWGYLDLVDGEASAMLALARRELPNANLHGLGHSLGGQVALLHAARYPHDTLASLMLSASATPHYRAYPFPYRLKVYAFTWLVTAMANTLGVFRGDWLGFGGRQGASLMREWSRFSRSGRLTALGPRRWDAGPALADLRLPLFVLSMHGDSFAPASAARELAGMTSGSAISEHLKALHNGETPGHFGWLRAPDAVADRVAEWLQIRRS